MEEVTEQKVSKVLQFSLTSYILGIPLNYNHYAFLVVKYQLDLESKKTKG